MSQTVLFKQEGQHVYDYTNVYDPDTDGAYSSSSGKIIPAVRSIVIDNRSSDWKVLLVKAVDPTTYKVTYTDFPYKVYDQRSMILNYGNDVFMLYYDTRTKPKRLLVDAKMILFGSNICKYQLIKDGEVISYAAKTTEDSIDYEAGDTVPVVELTDKYVDGVRKCNACYTEADLADGDIVTLELYDSTGVVVAEVDLVAKASTILNSLSSLTNPIVAFTCPCNQEDGDHWYLYENQPTGNLSIYPTVKFADGKTAVVPVDNCTCFMYGMQDIDSANVGAEYPVVIKCYINNRYTIDPSLEVYGGSKRVLSFSTKVKIVNRTVGSISKVSVIPVWIESKEAYDLKFFAYKWDRDGAVDVTGRYMSNNTGNPALKTTSLQDGTTYDSTLFGEMQIFKAKMLSSDLSGFEDTTVRQFNLLLKKYSATPSTDGKSGPDRWQIIDPDNNDIVYGADTVNFNRPVIFYDGKMGVKKHYISSTLYSTKDIFLNVFYNLASPPYNTELGETTPPVPTHFRFRDVNGNLISGNAIEIANYHQGFTLNNYLSGEVISEGTVIMEFIRRASGLSDAILYGVPVPIERADGTYVADSAE